MEHRSLEPVHVGIYSLKTCIKLALHLQSVEREIYQIKQSHRVFPGLTPYRSNQATQCWICCSPLLNETIVSDHCHYSGKFLGYAHSQCNLKRRSVNYTPGIAHKSSNDDLHYLCQNLDKFDSEYRIEIVPLTDENYITFSIGVELNWR